MTRVSAVSILALSAMASPSFADVTSEEVWNNLESYLSDFGYEISATETATDNGLEVSGISYTAPLPEDGGTMVVTLPDMIYTDVGDGTVDMTMPESGMMEVTITPEGEDASPTVVAVALSHSGLLVNASGTPEEMTYESRAEEIRMVLDSVTDEGELLPKEALKTSLSMGPVAGTSVVSIEDGLRSVSQDMTYGDITYDFAFTAPEDDETKGLFSGTLRGLAGKGTTVVPDGADMSDAPAMLASGFEVDASITHQGGETSFDFQDGSDRVTGQLSSDGGELGFAMSQEKMVYVLSALGQSVSMMVPDMPFPIEGKFGEAGFSFEMPLAASEEPVPASLSVLLSDFEMADMLWGIFDPQGVLPRDPATIGANLEAEVTPFVSIIDEDAMEAVEEGEELPGELNKVTLTDLVVRAIGAEILGEGEFTFDNTDTETFDGMPRPEGQIDLTISGVNGVIDKLIEMGFVQEQDAMGARMMLGMFTVPGAEPDTATSTILVNDQGHVLANGQRIK
ncbi:hypothetical protein GGQ68_000625 [Sagittula marina]|uniref:DUF2125 domain-containing protein n=1 Tax=Sagittula marina TaxID=943940 RepID=A0A7W6DSF5_9RHOB|nr:DUF2125 domain-containing protein [Sagittula marina]MBB3984314.1 hypothetical protein [Sagittula marina]